jgi:hypothetical protein
MVRPPQLAPLVGKSRVGIGQTTEMSGASTAFMPTT